VRLADGSVDTALRVRSRVVLAEALIHSLRGLDEEGVAALHEADSIALAGGDRSAVAHARAELGYVDFLRARYDRAGTWLSDALEFADGSPSITAKAMTYLGSVESDRGNYAKAVEFLEEANKWSDIADEPRRKVFGLSVLGRISLLRGDFAMASEQLDASIALAESEHWLAILPWPQALSGEAQLACGNASGASEILGQAFARACQLGDPCWEGLSARGLALVAEAKGETALAFELLADARARSNRFADPYVWLDGYILDTQCRLGLRHRHADTERWANTLHELASRTGMKELNVRSLLHLAALGHVGAGPAAALLADDIDNRSLHLLVSASQGVQSGL